jgi:[ribosomal protein S5]-alanine N-acetyltransferase
MQQIISTARLTLHLISTDDHAFIQQLVNSKGWLTFIGDRNVHSTEDAIAYINKIISTKDLFYWVVKTKDTNTSIGIISFLKRSYLNHFDIGFAFLPQFQGAGYAYEAAKEVLKIVSSIPQHKTVLATTVPGNTKSIQLLMKLGLRFEKEMEIEQEKLHVYTNHL